MGCGTQQLTKEGTTTMTWLQQINNPWLCDEDLLWVQERQIKGQHNDQYDMLCYLPYELRDEKVLEYKIVVKNETANSERAIRLHTMLIYNWILLLYVLW